MRPRWPWRRAPPPPPGRRPRRRWPPARRRTPRPVPPSFFFSSRRRHTRSLCDWSSDVCSSDLGAALTPGSPVTPAPAVQDDLHVGFAGKLAPQVFPEARLITRDDKEVTVRQLPVFHGCLPAVISHPRRRVKNPRGDGAPAAPRALPSTAGAGSRACRNARVARLRRRPSSTPTPLTTLGGIHRRR